MSSTLSPPVGTQIPKNDTPLMQFACFRFLAKILLGPRFVKIDAPLKPNACFRPRRGQRRGQRRRQKLELEEVGPESITMDENK